MALSRVSSTQSRRPTAPPQQKQYRNADGPGGSTIDYGPSRGPTQKDIYNQRRQDLGNSPYYGRQGDTTPMPWADEGTPFFTPNAGDPRNAGYFVQHDAGNGDLVAQSKAANRAAYNADPAYAQAAASGDIKGALARMVAMKQDAQRQRFMDQGGQGSTWDTRYQQSWPVPASPTGNYQYGPGRPGPTPPGVAQGGGAGSSGRGMAMDVGQSSWANSGAGAGGGYGSTISGGSGQGFGLAGGGGGGGNDWASAALGRSNQAPIMGGSGAGFSPYGGGGGQSMGMPYGGGQQFGGGDFMSILQGGDGGGFSPYGGGYNPGASTGTSGLYGGGAGGYGQYGGGGPMFGGGGGPMFGGGQQMGGGGMAMDVPQGLWFGGGMTAESTRPFIPPGWGGGGRTPIGGGPMQPVNPNPPNRTFGYQQPPFQGQTPMEGMGGMLGIPGYSPYGGGYY